jgi:hypothetical protein
MKSLERAWRTDVTPHDDGRHCPGDEAIHDAVTGTASIEQRRRIVDHTAVCGACSQSWRLALELERAQPGVTVMEARPRQAPQRAVNWIMAAAAAIVAAIGIVWLLPQFDPGIPPPSGSSVLRGNEQRTFELQGPKEFRLDEASLTLSWEPVEGAREYRVRIVNEALVGLHAETVDEARLTLSSKVLEQTVDGQTIFWFVQAEMSDGSVLRSETASAIVRRSLETPDSE